jgi:hypothetical protein
LETLGLKNMVGLDPRLDRCIEQGSAMDGFDAPYPHTKTAPTDQTSQARGRTLQTNEPDRTQVRIRFIVRSENG